tara:strand:- start:4535 stop:4999 length:465 start_codon:yes stop_codon:yes gene_type:complete
MSLITDFYKHNVNGLRLRYKILEFLNLKEWVREARYRKQRINRGWSDRDAWGGGEHIAEVSAGILRELNKEQNIVDWDWYFRENEWETFGYKNLDEVAQDIENYLDWELLSYSEPLYSQFGRDYETRWQIEIQLYEDYRQAMRFVAENIGALWW